MIANDTVCCNRLEAIFSLDLNGRRNGFIRFQFRLGLLFIRLCGPFTNLRFLDVRYSISFRRFNCWVAWKIY